MRERLIGLVLLAVSGILPVAAHDIGVSHAQGASKDINGAQVIRMGFKECNAGPG